MTFRALILAAGRGSRMRRMTDEAPKCLVPLAGRPLLEWQTEALRNAGALDVTVVRGYQKEKISGNVLTIDNEEWSTSNMVVSLTKASGLLGRSPCIVSYSDIVYHPSHVVALEGSGADIAITYDLDWLGLWKARNESDPLADAETFHQEDGWLKSIGAKPRSLDEVHGQYMGLLRFNPAGWNAVEAHLATLTPERIARLDMTSLLSQLLAKETRIAAVPVRGRWCECDTESDLEAYERLLEESDRNGRRWHHDWR